MFYLPEVAANRRPQGGPHRRLARGRGVGRGQHRRRHRATERPHPPRHHRRHRLRLRPRLRPRRGDHGAPRGGAGRPTGSLRRSIEMLGRRSTRRRARRARRRGARRRPTGRVPPARAATARSRSCTSTARPGTRTRRWRRAAARRAGAAGHPRHPLRHRRGTPTSAASTRRGRAHGRGRRDDRREATARCSRPRRCCSAVTLAAVLGMSRLFDGGGWLRAAGRQRGRRPPRGHGDATPGPVAARRRRWSWSSARPSSSPGPPTGRPPPWRPPHRRHVVRHAHRPRRRVGALPGRRRARRRSRPASCWPAALALWCIAYVADWAAFRLWVPVRGHPARPARCSCSPRCSARRGARLGGRPATPARCSPSCSLHRMARQDGTSHWVADRRAPGQPLAADGGRRPSASWPCWPARSSDRRSRAPTPPGVLDPRSLRGDDNARVTVSPLVDIRSRLVDQPDRRGVHGPQPRARPTGASPRWRSSTARSGRRAAASATADGALPEAVEADVATSTFEQSFTISRPRRHLAARRLRTAGPRRRRREACATTRSPPPSSSTTTSTTQRRPHLPRHVRVAPHHRRRPRAAPAASSPTTSATASSPCPTASARGCATWPSEITADATTPAEQARPCRTTSARSPTRSRCQRGHSEDVARGLPVHDQARATASSSRAPSRRWPARSACRRGWPWGSPPATRTPTSPGCTTCAASTPTPGPRSTSRARGGCSTSRPRVAAP